MRDRDRERAREITGFCACHENYAVHNLTDPSCPFHRYADDIAEALAEARAQAETERDAALRANESLHDQLRATKDAKSEIAELVAMRHVVAAALELLAAEERAKAAREDVDAYHDAMVHGRKVNETFHGAVAEYRRQHPTEDRNAE